jgi:hypothetical protein
MPRLETAGLSVPGLLGGNGDHFVRTWMLLIYKVPNEPTSARVYVWRKLKKLGASLLHDAVWVLPGTAQTREQLRWLGAEIVELSGEATVWESRLMSGDEDQLVQQFVAAVEPVYREILSALKKDDPDLAMISRRYQQVRMLDYFDSTLGRQVREALVAAKGGSK